MTQEDKDLLLKDFCSRLPYGVKVKLGDNPNIFDLEYRIKFAIMYGNSDKLEDILDITNIKPYLFPLSSMTEEQKEECFKGTPLEIDKYGDIAAKDNSYGGSQYTDLENYLKVINWLFKNHFDILGLIPMGLALDATGLNIY